MRGEGEDHQAAQQGRESVLVRRWANSEAVLETLWERAAERVVPAMRAVSAGV